MAQTCLHTHTLTDVYDQKFQTKREKSKKNNCQDWDSNPSISRYCGTPLFRGKKLNFLEHSALDHSAILAYLLETATRNWYYGVAETPEPQRIVR